MSITGEITVKPAAFQAAVAWAAKWVTSKPVIPLHAGLMFDADAGALTIGAYSENATARAVIEYDGDGAGRAVVSGRLMAGLVATLTTTKLITIAAEDASIGISAGRFHATLPVLDSDDTYPALPGALPAVGIIPGDALADAVRRCGVAVGDINKGAMLGVMHFDMTRDAITLTATNRYRAASVRAPWNGPTVPMTATPLGLVVVEAAASLAGPDEISIGCDGMVMSFTSPTRSMTVRLVDLPPDPKGVRYPTEAVSAHMVFPHRLNATLTTADMIMPLKRAGMVREKDGPIKVTLAPGTLTVTADAGWAGVKQSGDDEVDAVYDGEEISIAFNPQYLGEALASAPTPTVTMGFGEARKSISFSAPGDDSWHHILMPIDLSK